MDEGFRIRLMMNKNLEKKQLRKFGLIVGLGLPFIVGFLIPTIYNHNYQLWTFLLGSVLIIIAIISPTKLKVFYKFWMFVGEKLGWINSRIILFLVFIVVLQPISIIIKLLGYDPLNLKIRKDLNSYKKKNTNPNFNLKRIF